MSYWYHVEAPNEVPLLLFLHGRGDSGGDPLAQTTKHGPWKKGEHVQNAKVLEQLREYFRVAPHLASDKDYWNAGDLGELVTSVRQKYEGVLLERMFVIGISRGGKGALDFAAHPRPGLVGVVVVCPEHIDHLDAALEHVPVLLFHGDGDAVVHLDEPRVAEYEGRKERPNFRWIRVHKDWAIPPTDPSKPSQYHASWPHVIGHPDLYTWFARLSAEPEYRNQKNLWPDFADLTVPKIKPP
jgi:predicted peptidase